MKYIGVFVGAIAFLTLIAVGCFGESLIPAAIIHFAAGVSFWTVVEWWSIASFAVVLGFLTLFGTVGTIISKL